MFKKIIANNHIYTNREGLTLLIFYLRRVNSDLPSSKWIDITQLVDDALNGRLPQDAVEESEIMEQVAESAQ